MSAGQALLRACKGWPGIRDCIRVQRSAKHLLAHSLRFRLMALFVMLALAMACACLRLIKGPAAQDRVLALDCMYLNGMLAILVIWL